MPFYHEVIFTATLERDATEKKHPFDVAKKTIAFLINLGPTLMPKGFEKFEEGKGGTMWVSMDEPAEFTIPEFLKKGRKVLIKGRLTGGTKDATLPTAYYFKASEILEVQNRGSINSFVGRGKITKIADNSPMEGTTKLLIMEPKRAFGGKKPDYTTNAGYHFYMCLANKILDKALYKPGEYFTFHGRLAAEVFDTTDASADEKKRLSQPLFILTQAIS